MVFTQMPEAHCSSLSQQAGSPQVVVLTCHLPSTHWPEYWVFSALQRSQSQSPNVRSQAEQASPSLGGLSGQIGAAHGGHIGSDHSPSVHVCWHGQHPLPSEQ